MRVRIPLLVPMALIASAAAMAGPAPASAQSSFEGVVTLQVDGGPMGKQSIKYSMKGNKMRMDMSTGGMQMYSLFNRSEKTVDMVIPMRKMYMQQTVDADRIKAGADSAMAAGKLTWTGKKETIAGHECEHATFKDSTGKATDVCFAKGLGSFMSMPGGLGGIAGWKHHVGQSFPLKIVRDGKVEMVATSIEKKSLPDSLFSVPAGYTKMSMPGRGGGR